MIKLADPESFAKCLRFYKDFIIDRMGYQVKVGETAITEGWCVPRYENEYQNLLGLPFYRGPRHVGDLETRTSPPRVLQLLGHQPQNPRMSCQAGRRKNRFPSQAVQCSVHVPSRRGSALLKPIHQGPGRHESRFHARNCKSATSRSAWSSPRPTPAIHLLHAQIRVP